MADRNGILDSVTYLGFLAQGTSNRNGASWENTILNKYTFIEFSFHLVEQFKFFKRSKY
jgi:hypothetical protein